MSEITKGADGLSMMVECEDCGMKFRISTQNAIGHLQHKKEYQAKGRSIYLTYYDCPSCGRRHFVQIDDNRTLEILKANQRMFTKLAAKRLRDKPIPQSQSDKYKKHTKHLCDCRTQLMKEFTGVMLHDDETDTSFELRFSV